MEGSHPTSFSPVTCTNVEIYSQNFLTFDFYRFVILVLNYKAKPSASPKLLNLNQDNSFKKEFLWQSPYKIKVMVTLIKVLQLPNFGHITTSTL